MSASDRLRSAAHCLQCAELATVWSVRNMWRRRAEQLMRGGNA